MAASSPLLHSANITLRARADERERVRVPVGEPDAAVRLGLANLRGRSGVPCSP